jgi:hypothetical protein
MSWLHRASLRTPVADPFDAASGFIALAEQQINERLRARCMVVRGSQTIDGQYTTLPCDYLEAIDCRMANGGPPVTYESRYQTAAAFNNHVMNTPPAMSLAGMGPDFIPALPPPGYAWGDGTPQRFSVVGAEIEWSPFPFAPDPLPEDFAWPVAELAYFQRVMLGPADADTNPVLATYPAIYLYGALMHAAPFVRDDGRVQLWGGLFSDLVEGANREHSRARHAGSPLRATYRRLA